MATSAFKSTTKRTSLGNSSEDSSSSRTSVHRRARSLSRFSRRLPGAEYDDDELTPGPRSRGRFVNTVRGSGFPEISLDDLATELFHSSLRGRSASRNVEVSSHRGDGVKGGGESVSQRRGRSVSRQGSRGSFVNGGGGGRLTSDTASSRRRRSVSVVRYQISDSESDLDHSQNSSNRAIMRSSIGGNNQISSNHKPTVSNSRKGLRRSLSQKDLKYHDGYSSHSSALTDDEVRDALPSKNGKERTIRAVYAQKKGEHPTGDDVNGGLYAAMRKELRHAVEEIKTQLEHAMVKTKQSGITSGDGLQRSDSEVLKAVSTNRRKCTTKLEKSEKHIQDILAEIVLEEQHGREQSKTVKEAKNSVVEKPLRARKRSNDRNRMSMQLTEEAEKYIEDFISNVEDTDFSSLDGDRSDTSSSIGGITKTPNFQSPLFLKSVPVEMDGVTLPWLQWETSNDASPFSCQSKRNLSQDASSAQDISNQISSSRGSWSPAFTDCPSVNIGENTRSKFEYESQCPSNGANSMQYDLDDYINLKSNEAFLHEIWNQRHKISSGGLLLCNQMFF